MKNKPLTLLLLIIVVKTGWTQNTNLDYKSALKIYNLTTFEEQITSRRFNDSSSYRYRYTNTTLQIYKLSAVLVYKLVFYHHKFLIVFSVKLEDF